MSEYKYSINNLSKIPFTSIIENRLSDTDYTFGVCTYKRSNVLVEALESIYSQNTNIQFNVIVTDNNPERNDETEKLITEKYNDKNNLHYLKNSVNIGVAGNWNRMFQQCKTKYLIMLHDDDVLFKSYLKRMCYLIKKFPNATAINCEKITWNGIDEINKESMPKNFLFKHTVWTNILHYDYNTPSGCLFNTKDMLESGGYSDEDGNSLDYALTMRFIISDKQMLKTAEPLMLYRWGNNASTKYEVLHNLLINDYRLKEEVAERISMNKMIYKFLQYIDVRIRLRSIKKINGINETFKGMKPAGSFTVILCSLTKYMIYKGYKANFCKIKI